MNKAIIERIVWDELRHGVLGPDFMHHRGDSRAHRYISSGFRRAGEGIAYQKMKRFQYLQKNYTPATIEALEKEYAFNVKYWRLGRKALMDEIAYVQKLIVKRREHAKLPYLIPGSLQNLPVWWAEILGACAPYHSRAQKHRLHNIEKIAKM